MPISGSWAGQDDDPSLINGLLPSRNVLVQAL